MKGRYYQEIHNVKAHIISLYIVIVILAIITVLSLFGWKSSESQIRVHIPPDLRGGGVFRLGEVPLPNVYSFTHYIFQQLNNWPESAREDYSKNIFLLQYFMTPRFQRQIKGDLDIRAKRGELDDRTREVQERLGEGFTLERVKVIGPSRWEVTLDYNLIERANNLVLKDLHVRYTLYVVRYDADPERNPWGLALDGFAKPVERIDSSS